MKRSPMPKRRTTKRRTTTPRCSIRGCQRPAKIRGWCVSHAEQTADRLFSRWVRDRNESCTAAGLLPGRCSGNLQAAHVNGRRKYVVRFDPRNCWSLCQTHHYLVDQHGREAEKRTWAIFVLGSPARYDALMEDAMILTKRERAIEEALSWLT